MATLDLTYNEVRDGALNLACKIAAASERGTAIGIALPFGAAYPVAMLAALAAGRPFVPLDLDGPQDRTTQIVQHSQLKVMIVSAETSVASSRVAPGIPQIRFDTSRERADADILASPLDVSHITYTSGSTGQPKGVYHNQRNLVHHALLQTLMLHLSADDRVMLIQVPTASRALPEIFGALLNGARLYIVDLRRKGLQEIVRTMHRGRITTFFAVPNVFRELLKVCREAEPFAAVRHLALGTDRIFAADIELFRQRFPENAQISVQLGSTEAKTFCHWFVPRDWPLAERILPVGYVLPDYTLRLLDGQGVDVQPGEIGTISIASSYIGLGYWNDDEATAQSFFARDDGMRVFCSGDLGRVRPDGLLELIGREDRQLKIRGNRVEPQEIEAVLRMYPGVDDAAVIPRPSGETIDLVAYIVVDSELAPTRSAIATWLIDRLPDALRPKEFVLVGEIPKLPNFKHDLQRLSEIDRSRSDRERAPPLEEPNGEARQHAALRNVVHDQWRRAFGARAVETDTTWQDAGGDSLKALQFIFELERTLRRPVPMAVLGPRTRPSELIAGLKLPRNGPVSFRAKQATHSTIFFLPGYRGPTIHQMHLVQSLAHQTQVKVLDYPPIEPSKLEFCDFENMVDHVIEPIRDAALAGEPVRLLGYSFGGAVAFECARILAAEHHRIAFLGIIDAPAHSSTIWNIQIERRERSLSSGSLHPSFARIGTLIYRPQYFLQRLVSELLHRERLGLVAFLWKALDLTPFSRLRVIFRETIKEFLRLRAHYGYRPAPYEGDLVLFKAANGRATINQTESEDLGWSRLCNHLTTIQIPGDHLSIFSSTHLGTTSDAIVSAIS